MGAIKPEGWLKLQLEAQRDGLTGNLDEVYSNVVGPRNAWIGGDGDAWERGPYWIDGLLPLAYILGDDALKSKAAVWVEAILNSQAEDGYFGPSIDRGPEPGLQSGLLYATVREYWSGNHGRTHPLRLYYASHSGIPCQTIGEGYRHPA